MSTVEQSKLTRFFEYLFSHDQGFISIATTRPPARRDTFNERFFAWPDEKDAMVDYIEKVTPTHNVYFGVNILSAQRRKKENTIPQNLVWADLDTCRPDTMDIPPQCVIESSPEHYQAIWKLDRKVDPLIAENYSKRIAYAYSTNGADKSGHDLTQLLRVPGTYNFKYQMQDTPVVQLLASVDSTISTDIFDGLAQPEGYVDVPDLDVPVLSSLPSVEMIIYRYQDAMNQAGVGSSFARYYSEEPSDDWSGQLWRMLLICFEIGMTAEEAFVVAKHSKSNKYERDGRPDSHLWREVLKAELERKSVEALLQDHRYLSMPALLSASEEMKLKGTIIDDYKSWATSVTDSVPDFHELTCAMVMSALMSTTLRLQTSRPRAIIPNIWGLIIGESTVTRKSTAMDMGVDFIMDIQRDLMVASDATVEGLISALALRPKMVSIFYRDEVSGLFEAMAKRDYLSGMQETLTKMYDVPLYMTRTLRKETFTLSEPIFIFFGGGVPDKMYSLIDEQYFASGFMPRFLIMRGYGDVAKIKPTGKPTQLDVTRRAELLSTFQAYYDTYTDVTVTQEIPTTGEKMLTTPDIMVEFTDAMWDRVATIEMQLITAAHESPEATRALPMFSRMFVSLLKLCMLFAASRQQPKDFKVKANMNDLLVAAHYIQKWGTHAVDLIRNSGVTGDESQLMSVYRTIEQFPGVLRGDVMRRHRLNARNMQVIEETLAQRMMVKVQVAGRARTYWPIGR
jgi:hypothetical protein